MPALGSCLHGDTITVPAPPATYPVTALMFQRYAIVGLGNPLVINHQAAQDFGHECVQWPGANGDRFIHYFYLAAGNYVLNILGTTEPGSGLIDWYIDGVLQFAGQDWYTVGIVQNVVTANAVIVVGSGQHVLTGIVNGQNVASGGFNIYLTALALV
jgi:hypothetical protein